MKTANKQIILLSWVLGAIIGSTPVWAEPAASTVPSMESSAMPSPAGAAAHTPSVYMPKMAANIVNGANTEVKIPDLSRALPANKKDPKDDPSEIKVPDSVKDVIKRLSTKTEDVTLDDLNAAREAVAKLDALIDIEKRLQDLDKIRDERNKENEKKLVEAIPRTALAPPPAFMPRPIERAEERRATSVKPVLAPTQVDVVRIEGSNGRYGAVVNDGSDQHLVHAGDHLTDGTVVVAVTTQGVEFERDDKTHMAQVKDVQSVFGDSP